MINVSYNTGPQAPAKRGYYTALECDVTASGRTARTVAMAVGRVLLLDPHSNGNSNTANTNPVGDYTVYTAADTSSAVQIACPIAVVTGCPKPGETTAQPIDFVDAGPAQALVAAENLAIGALLYLKDATGTLTGTPIGTATGMDTPAELTDISKRPVAVLCETQTNAAVALRWVRILPQ